ncbi:MAG: 4-alpha-glucanotransferase [Oscillospiraceae bacterium]
MNGKRAGGVLMHLSSLPSPHGIGTMGQAARDFVDLLARAGQSYWQILPIGPTGYGDSPYQSFSTFAGNPYFIDLDELADQGLLRANEYEDIDWESTPESVNYGALYRKRRTLLRKAEERVLAAPPADFGAFCEKNAFWLEDYALFMTLKDTQDGAPWYDWPEELRSADREALNTARKRFAGKIAARRAEQYLFFRQWNALRDYAGGKGIAFIGDVPIYVALDSADVWANPALFQLDETRRPRDVAGCPPDAFSEDGQLWGNPLYDWERMAGDGYAWWVRRIGFLCDVYNVLRIDHFRGFEAYYAIPYGDTTAKNGRWRPGPGMELFRAVEGQLGRRAIIAEDLGFLTDGVRQLLADSGFPGMRVLEFAFDHNDKGQNGYLPHNMPRDCVAYIGTHDNDTVLGWLEGIEDPADREMAVAYMGLNREEGYNWGAMRALWASPAELTVVQAQDLLGLGSEGRMNTPSTTGGNWRWRALPGAFTPELADKLRRCMGMFGRLPEEREEDPTEEK